MVFNLFNIFILLLVLVYYMHTNLFLLNNNNNNKNIKIDLIWTYIQSCITKKDFKIC